ncbi:S-layer homology domain-containing protein [Megasphaera butyrica]|uniref:S-layer homology domain-containing protein n=1 Tax=Megasphaera butyrica TaxID=2981791 RepID=UPI00082148CD|nr:S-layer homology domain-containing protein [Megasphaera butyrica]MCU6714921.1 S-layer homology domain-containing protein [Megasphaera butyrica]SCH83925.1 Outer membrane protein alpha precursor [uncultured Megasphaera sp.]SCJ42663.1 Outer membrane protein alpha precursor [uncultured Ruminococcus sp.]
MKKIKKARSMAAVLAVMALTAGSTMAADLTSKGSASIGDYPLADVSVTATGEDVAASLDGQTLKNVIIDGYATSEGLSNVAIQANTALNGMTENAKNIGDLQTQVEKNTIDIGGLQSTVADHQTQINNAAGMADAAYNGMTQNTQDINNLDNQINGKDGIVDELGDVEAKADGALKVQGNGVLYNHGTDLTTGINLNTSAIEQEANDREAADGDLQSQIDTNKTNIGNLDNQINGKDGIVDELGDVEAKADGALKVQGNGVLYNHGTDLTTGINLNTSAIEQEVKDRETADQQLQQGINTNTAAINSVKTTVGSGVLTSGAADLTTGINQNYAQIQQNYAQIQQNTNAINSLDSRIDDLGGEIDQVGAVSAALAGLHPLDYDGTGSKFQLSAAMGSYDSSQAAAIGAFYHFNRDVMISLGGATSFDGDHKTAGNLGVTFRIGEGASGKAVSDDVMARLEAMDQKIAALEQENKDLKNVLGAIDTSLSKEFPDVPANHWAYEAVTKLAGNDVVAGYPDGEFHGDRTMTRYEMAEIIYKAMNRGVQVDQKLVNEFKPEMEQVAASQNA